MCVFLLIRPASAVLLRGLLASRVSAAEAVVVHIHTLLIMRVQVFISDTQPVRSSKHNATERDVLISLPTDAANLMVGANDDTGEAEVINDADLARLLDRTGLQPGDDAYCADELLGEVRRRIYSDHHELSTSLYTGQWWIPPGCSRATRPTAPTSCWARWAGAQLLDMTLPTRNFRGESSPT